MASLKIYTVQYNPSYLYPWLVVTPYNDRIVARFSTKEEAYKKALELNMQ